MDDTADGDTGAPIPPPPPDLGARRILTTRLMTSLDGRSVAVALAVEEARALGVDGGWTVTVTGPSHGSAAALAVGARPTRPDGDVGLIIGRTHVAAGAMGFTVVGQRSTTVYDATYDGVVPVGPFREGTPPVITVTLFQ
ncbi:MAG: hypothetical protein KY461_02620 [Actinobacteria bacterium]|nr:hypothetical protein [Actinomycetota bacterium]